jgi:hypothetical protein
LEIALTAFGDEAMWDHMDVFIETIRQAVDSIYAGLGQDVLIQVESPKAMYYAVAMDDGDRAIPDRLLPPAMARHLLAPVDRLPADAAVGIHLCNGDFNHIAHTFPRSTKPIALLTAEILAEAARQGKSLRYIHFPLGSGDVPPRLDKAFYRDLHSVGELVPADVQLFAGLVHEDLSDQENLDLLHMVEDTLGRQVGIATPCGLARGRGSEKPVQMLIERMVELARTG